MLQYDVMNISDCAMSKENTPIFSCVPHGMNTSVTPEASKLDDREMAYDMMHGIMKEIIFNGDVVDETKGMNLTMQNAMCENRRERHKIEDNILGSWRCLDIIRHSEDALTHTCIRPGKIFTSYFAS